MLRVFAAVIVAASAAGCAAVTPLPTAQVSDPFEATNRAVFAVNDAFNQVVTFPLAKTYMTVVPAPLRQGLANGTANLNEPTVFANTLLQGRWASAGASFGRFAVNSTIGIGGIFDVATLGGIPKQTGDFGQTLYVWGVHDSPYIIIPFAGPSTVRDAIGYGIDSTVSPGFYAIWRINKIASYAVGGFDGFRRSAELQQVDDSAVDPYSRLRSVYYQSRRRELLDGIGRKDDVFEPSITDGTAAKPVPVPPEKPKRRAGGNRRGEDRISLAR